MLTRVTRWFLIMAPVVAGAALLIFGTAGGISVAFGIVLIGMGPVIWMWNWFIRMSFDEEREKEARRQAAREKAARDADQGTATPSPADPTTLPPTAREQHIPVERQRQTPATHPHHHAREPGRLRRRPR